MRGTLRLRVIAGEAWRTVLTPDPVRGAVTLPAALEAGAVVVLRTWVDDLPDEARAITTLFWGSPFDLGVNPSLGSGASPS